ncbi:MAG: GNAT family N-acetyltransferase [Acidimicrobiales bacterium]
MPSPSTQPGSALRLRRLTIDDGPAFDAAHRATTDYLLGLGYTPGMPFADYLAELERQRCGHDLPDHLVPATFLVAVVGGEIVGRSSIRHELNDFLRREGGHIGYCVVPEHRGNGYATEILAQSLIVARSVGVESALLVCDDDNTASAVVIEGAGGRLVDVVEDGDGQLVRRYWID